MGSENGMSPGAGFIKLIDILDQSPAAENSKIENHSRFKIMNLDSAAGHLTLGAGLAQDDSNHLKVDL